MAIINILSLHYSEEDFGLKFVVKLPLKPNLYGHRILSKMYILSRKKVNLLLIILEKKLKKKNKNLLSSRTTSRNNVSRNDGNKEENTTLSYSKHTHHWLLIPHLQKQHQKYQNLSPQLNKNKIITKNYSSAPKKHKKYKVW